MKINLNDIYLFEMPELHYFEHTCDIRHFALKKIVESQEQTLRETKSSFREQLDSDPAFEGLSERDKSSYYDQMYSYEEETIRKLEQLQRYATCQVIFASFEGQLKNLISIIETYMQFKIAFDEVKDNGDINRFWKYMTKVVGIDSEDIETIFKKINGVKHVRNMITHKDGLIKEKKLNQIPTHRYLKKIKQTDEYKLVIANPEYLIDLLKDIHDFFEKLLIELDQIYKKQNS